MTIDEMMTILAVGKKELGGDAQVVQRDEGSDKPGVVRVEAARVETAVIEDLGNGVAGWTLGESKPETRVKCLLLD